MRRSQYSILLLFVTSVACGEVLIGRANDWPQTDKSSPEWLSETEYYEVLGREAGIEIVVEHIPWTRAMTEIRTRPIIMSQLSLTKDREKVMHFIGPHMHGEIIIVMDRKFVDATITNLEDLIRLAKYTGLKVGYQINVRYSGEFDRKIAEDQVFREHFYGLAKYNYVHRMVVGGRLMGYLDDRDSATRVLRQERLYDKLMIHPYVLATEPWYFGVSKAVSQSTLDKLRAANQSLIDKGVYQEIWHRRKSRP